MREVRGGTVRAREGRVSKGKDLGLIPRMKGEAIRGFGSEE